MRYSKLILAMLLTGTACSFAQTTFQEQAARLQNINAYLLDFRPATPPAAPDGRSWELVFDANPQPSIDARVGNKDEPLDPPSVVPKLRFRYVFDNGFHVGGAFAPGIELEDYDAEFISLEAGFRFSSGAWRFGPRVSYSDGDVTGPITEVAAEDFFVFENKGVDFSVARLIGDFHVYGFIGYNDIETSVEVESDAALIRNEDDTIYGGVGASWDRGPWRAVLEQNVTDSYLRHLIFSVMYRF